MVPFDTESPFVTSGIRLGTAAVTSRGVTIAEIQRMVDLIDRTLMDTSETNVEVVKKEVQILMGAKPLFAW
jgi:glycine hydroxymethyltransferase